MDYVLIADFIAHAEYLLTVNERKRHELVMKAAWSEEDELLADELDYEHEELLDDIADARDALSQCD
jgi:hypothetical protein